MAETGAILRGQDIVARNIKNVRKAVEKHMFAQAVEAACRLIVNESKNQERALAWNDVTANLRASISFQVENVVGAKPFVGHHADGSPTMFNDHDYRSGMRVGTGEYAVVFAPPDYALHVEAKSSRSVLLAPMATVRGRLRAEMADEGRKAFAKFVFGRRELDSIT